ncbi:MAG: peptidase M75 [Thermosynechococcaceae cyanobacterium MS004]|nr:peptidase M75 [Thermosynechococcaceae cyanobacterium MS004]
MLNQVFRLGLWGAQGILVYGLLMSCSNASKTTISTPLAGASGLDRQILVDVVDKVMIPNYGQFAERAADLSRAIAVFSKTPDESRLKAAQVAWVNARGAWEQTECFAFGPASSLGYDGALDTWPVNEVDVKALLNSKTTLTADTIDQLKDTEKGFHVIEYFLFGAEQPRQAAELQPKELTYLKLMGENFAGVAQKLAQSWSQGIEGKPAYREVLTTAGLEGNAVYPTLVAGFEELVQGMVDSLDEVANEKLGETLEKKDPRLAESRFSLNTLSDIKSNLRGVENLYLGKFAEENLNGLGLSAYVAQVSPKLDKTVKEQIEQAETALDQIPAPLESAILDPKAAASIQVAQSALNKVRETLEGDVKPLMTKS